MSFDNNILQTRLPSKSLKNAPRKRLRVLLLAEMCNPVWTSVPLVGYNMARALAEHPYLEVTLVTQIRNQPALQHDEINEHAHVVYIDTEFVAHRAYQIAKVLRGGNKLAWTIDTAMMWPSYICFEQMVYRQFYREFQLGEFDLIHRLTPLTPTIPSPLASWVSTPMIWGPINGGLPWPKEFANLRWKEREWLNPVRGLHRLMPYYKSTFENLAGLIVGSEHTATEVPDYFNGRLMHMPENGIDLQRFPPANVWPCPKGKFRFINVCRMVPLKGLDLIIEAMAGSKILRKCELILIGDGPERNRLERMVEENGLQNNVFFRGWLPQSAVARELAEAQAFVFPSLKEFGGGCLLEAMVTGLPCVIVDYGGPAEIVNPQTGILIPMQAREKLIPDLRNGMETLVNDPHRCLKMSNRGVDRVRMEFTWSRKADRIATFYHKVLDPGSEASILLPPENSERMATVAGS